MKIMTKTEKEALLGLCEIYKLLATDDAISMITVLLQYDQLAINDLKIMASIDEHRFEKMFDALVLCQIINHNSDIVMLSTFGKNVMKLTEAVLGDIRKHYKGQRSSLIS